MKALYFICFSFLACSVSGQKTVVIDIDNTLAWSTCHQATADDIIANYPALILIKDLKSHPGWFYIFLPYIRDFFDYLIAQDCEIVFFSAGVKARNEELIDIFLAEIYAPKELSALREKGHFKIFSRCHMSSALIYTDDEYEAVLSSCGNSLPQEIITASGEQVKSLRRIFSDRSINDLILIDDLIKNASMKKFAVQDDGKYQLVPDMTEHPLIRTFDSPSFIDDLALGIVQEEHHPVYNNMAYFCGVIKTAFDAQARMGIISFREAIGLTLVDSYYTAEIDQMAQHCKDFFQTGKNLFKARQDEIRARRSDFEILRDACTAPTPPVRRDSLTKKNPATAIVENSA